MACGNNVVYREYLTTQPSTERVRVRTLPGGSTQKTLATPVRQGSMAVESVSDRRSDKASDYKAGSDAADRRSDIASDDKAGSDAADRRFDKASDDKAGPSNSRRAPEPSVSRTSLAEKFCDVVIAVGVIGSITFSGNYGTGPQPVRIEPNRFRDFILQFSEVALEVSQQREKAATTSRDIKQRRRTGLSKTANP